MTVVNCGPFPRSLQQKRTVLNGTQPKDVDDCEGVFGKRGCPVPLFEIVEDDSLLLESSPHEGEFVLFCLARDDVSLSQQTLLCCNQYYFAACPFGKEESEQCALRHESFVTETKNLPLINHISDLLTVRQQTRKVFPVISHQIVEKLAVG